MLGGGILITHPRRGDLTFLRAWHVNKNNMCKGRSDGLVFLEARALRIQTRREKLTQRKVSNSWMASNKLQPWPPAMWQLFIIVGHFNFKPLMGYFCPCVCFCKIKGVIFRPWGVMTERALTLLYLEKELYKPLTSSSVASESIRSFQMESETETLQKSTDRRAGGCLLIPVLLFTVSHLSLCVHGKGSGQRHLTSCQPPTRRHLSRDHAARPSLGSPSQVTQTHLRDWGKPGTFQGRLWTQTS